MSARWVLDLTARSEEFGLVTAVFSNSILLYMLFYKANPSFGAYRRLMISYAVIEMVYSILSFTSGMMAHSTETSCISFNLYHGYVSRDLAPIFLVDFCGIYFTLILILVVHFIYRYVVVCDFHKLRFFNGPYLMFWVIGAAVSGFSLGYLKLWAFPEREHLTNELREEFSQFYNLSMEEVVYNGPNFYKCNEIGECARPSADWIMQLILTGGLVNSVIIMSYCGFCCCKKLRENRKHASCRTADLQNQLMIALIVQAVIPIVFMYIPILLFFTTPIFHIGFGPYINVAMATLAIYPPMDQFFIIYIIKDFRTALKEIFKCGKAVSDASSSSQAFSSRLT
ncbi:Serpentine receptor class r-10 [Caenorhabditis elegans]|uniref:Serpentine receptor class r-10 n=1 Tax=Caenorhabditis elegans TaxID=6239 RepID=O17996_CAEEL|nr:Seven TM Receptor [Caenorhabditis elegans]CAB04639.1 Seven TM Receptor [Caenorhabditis elegans]|eukprot:NP_506821.1 Seven TM Receptor [Caenorhabditis elegans]